MERTKNDSTVANFFFSAFAFSTLAFVQWEFFAFRSHLPLVAYVLPPIPLLALSLVAARRCMIHWTVLGLQPSIRGSTRAIWSMWSIPLFAIGMLAGFLCLAGSAFFVSLFVGSISLVPWTRISLARNSFFTAWAVILAGAAVCPVFTHVGAGPFPELAAIMFLALMSASFGLLAISLVLFAGRSEEEVTPPEVYVPGRS